MVRATSTFPITGLNTRQVTTRGAKTAFPVGAVATSRDKSRQVATLAQARVYQNQNQNQNHLPYPSRGREVT